MQKLRTIEDKVRAILKKDEEARNDDMVLYLKVCNSYFKDAGAMPFAEVMSQYRYLGLPSFESVGRTRRKLQAEHPEPFRQHPYPEAPCQAGTELQALRQRMRGGL